jgi:hypothetical protein
MVTLLLIHSAYNSRSNAVGVASDCLSSSPGRVNNFHFSISSRPALGLTQPPIQLVPRAHSTGVKR